MGLNAPTSSRRCPPLAESYTGLTCFETIENVPFGVGV